MVNGRNLGENHKKNTKAQLGRCGVEKLKQTINEFDGVSQKSEAC